MNLNFPLSNVKTVKVYYHTVYYPKKINSDYQLEIVLSRINRGAGKCFLTWIILLYIMLIRKIDLLPFLIREFHKLTI